MDKNLLDGIDQLTPDLNPKITNGLAKEQLMAAEQFIDETWRAAAREFPEGLTYEGYRRCTPLEEFNVSTKARDNKSQYELARSDFYMVAYNFSYRGKEMFPRYMSLPIVGDGGLLYVRGKRFAVSPVLADKAFSLGQQSMFIHLPRIKLNFERTTHHFMTNTGRESTYVVWSWVHTQTKKRNSSKKPNSVVYSTLANYMFARFGFTQSMLDFTGADVVVGEEDICPKNYPEDEWVICSSIGIRPRALKRKSNDYRSTRVRVAVRKDEYTQQVRSLIGSFFYIIDHFPDRITADTVDDVWIWKVVLGHILYESGTSEGLMVTELEDHLSSIDGYVDTIVQRRLSLSGISCDTIYEFFMYVIETLSQKSIADDTQISSIYDKQLITLRYVLYNVVSQIHSFMYDLRNMQKKRDVIEENEINNLMNRVLKPNAIAKISNHAEHPEVAPISTSNDNMFFGVTSLMVPQESSSGGSFGGKKSPVNLKDPSKYLHVSVAEIASYSNLPKADPTGRSRINPCVSFTSEYVVERDESKRELLDHVQRLIAR